MRHPRKALGVLLVLAAGLCPSLCLSLAPAADKAKPASDNLSVLSLEVAALQALDVLELRPKQLKALAEMARETAEKPRTRTAAKVSAQLRKVLTDLHAALLKQDDEAAGDLDGKLSELRESESPELDDDVEITAAARRRAPEFLKMLSATQVAAYISDKDFSDPFEVLTDALDEARETKGQEWRDVRDEAAAEVGKMLAGLDKKRAGDISAEVSKLLDKAHAPKKGEGAGQRARLEEEARKLLGGTGPLEVLRNQLEYNLAELLSNPRLPAAIEVRLKTVND